MSNLKKKRSKESGLPERQAGYLQNRLSVEGSEQVSKCICWVLSGALWCITRSSSSERTRNHKEIYIVDQGESSLPRWAGGIIMEYNMANLKAFTHDYTERTLANYNTIYNLYLKERENLAEKEIEDAFEVTQLINSLFGILIMPFESVKALKKGQMSANNMREINQKMRAVDPVAFDDLTKVIQELKDTRHFYDSYVKDYEDGIAEISFVHRLRNSLAHSGNNGLRFFPIGEGNQEVSRIKSIIFCDEEKNGKGESFVAELSVKQVERVVRSLAAIFGNFSEFEDFYDLAAYHKTIQSMRHKMASVYEGIFEFDKRFKHTVEDKCNGNLRIEKIDDNRQRGYTFVFDEMAFFAWIFQSMGKIKLVGPEEACNKMEQMVKAIQ